MASVAVLESFPESNSTLSAEELLDIACENSPVIKHAIHKYGELSLSDYLQQLMPSNNVSLQGIDDLVMVVHTYVSQLLGETIAQTVSQDLRSNPVVLAANHHGVDYFSQSVQGSLIFSLNKFESNSAHPAVPIFACGNVPLDNITYPRGLLLYHNDPAGLDDIPIRLPLFSDRQKRTLVSVAEGIGESMILRAEKRFSQILDEKKISPFLKEPFHKILRDDYGAPSVLGLSSYSQQSVVLNNRIWKRLFSDAKSAPELVYIELEKIVNGLLGIDLLDSNSLAWQIMFDPILRETVLEVLDGAKACWFLDRLRQRAGGSNLDLSQRKALNGGGTLFFWGIDSAGRRVPLYLETSRHKNAMLRGIDDRGNHWELPFTPSSIIEALNNNRLLPSLFTCFVVLSFARGVSCLGGYFKDEYFPVMKHGLARALRYTRGYQHLADYVNQVPNVTYLSGMLAVMAKLGEKYLIPAGPLEIIGRGGLTGSDIEKIKSLTIREAHFAGLFETIPDFAPWILREPGWKKQLAEDSWRLLGNKVVIK